MNKKMYNIGFGKKFVRELLLLRLLRYEIETKTSDEISEHEKKNYSNKIQAIKRLKLKGTQHSRNKKYGQHQITERIWLRYAPPKLPFGELQIRSER
jgi:hypothetical protein